MAAVIRQKLMISLLESLRELDPAVHDAALALLPSLHEEWLPVAECLRVYDLTFDALGERGLLELHRRTMARNRAGELLGPIFRAGELLLGRRPENYLRWVPNGWAIASRGMGKPSFSGNSGGGALLIEGVPPEVLASMGWRESLRMSMHAVVEPLGFECTSACEVDGDSISVELHWRPRQKASHGSAQQRKPVE